MYSAEVFLVWFFGTARRVKCKKIVINFPQRMCKDRLVIELNFYYLNHTWYKKSFGVFARFLFLLTIFFLILRELHEISYWQEIEACVCHSTCSWWEKRFKFFCWCGLTTPEQWRTPSTLFERANLWSPQVTLLSLFKWIFWGVPFCLL